MTYLTSWEDFEKNAERLYLQDPMKVNYIISSCNPDCLFQFSSLISDPLCHRLRSRQRRIEYEVHR